jgi:hypothetical protein
MADIEWQGLDAHLVQALFKSKDRPCLAQGPFDKLRAGKADVRFEPEE